MAVKIQQKKLISKPYSEILQGEAFILFNPATGQSPIEIYIKTNNISEDVDNHGKLGSINTLTGIVCYFFNQDDILYPVDITIEFSLQILED